MKEIHEYEKDLASIRTIMERSAKFLSLSGLSGILAGIYALAGAVTAYFILGERFGAVTPGAPDSSSYNEYASLGESIVIFKLLVLAAIVLTASLTTGFWLSKKKADRHGESFWSVSGRRLVLSLAIPLVTGGIFILIMVYNGDLGLVAPACLIFYGLALIQGSTNTVDEVRYIGYSEIILGLICATLPGYGLIFWSIGFGILHIVYGAIMYNKYDK